MHKAWLLLPAFFIPFLSSIIQAQGNSDVQRLLDEAKKRFAPDKRTAVFNVAGLLQGTRLTLTGEIQSQQLKKQLIAFVRERHAYVIVDNVETLPHSSLGDTTYGVVSASAINIRCMPGHAEELATQAILGTPLRILKRQGDWFYVQTPDEYLGWTMDIIAMFTKKQFEEWSSQRKVIVTSTYAHSYLTSNDSGEVVTDLVAGNILKLLQDNGQYFEVEYPKGKKAFVRKQDAELMSDWVATLKETPAGIVATAKRFMGVPYMWGGTSAKAMDCSGFTKTVFFLNGILLPRDASQQALVGESVSISENYRHLEAGDLVFFGTKAAASRNNHVTHVGIYLGNSKFIHEGGEVRMNSFNPSDPDYSEYRTGMLLSAARVIGVGEEHGIHRLAQIPYYKPNAH